MILVTDDYVSRVVTLETGKSEQDWEWEEGGAGVYTTDIVTHITGDNWVILCGHHQTTCTKQCQF